MRALIFNGQLVELAAADFPVHQSMQWVDAPLGATMDGYYWDGVAVSPKPGPTLAQAQSAQIATLHNAYQSAIQQSVSFTTAGGVTKLFQADTASQDVLVKTLQRVTTAGAVPSGFYWVAQDNTQVPFTLADLQGLDAVMFNQGWAAFQHNQALKAQVRAATTTAQVQAIVW